ncbi:MAG TPA: hypothetical protein VK178_18315 [Opitutaceae bacterium]|nr:hypothetical protein [Opitutaceae bacterium]
MKSAYELAMERLKAAEPDTAPLTPEQKERLAELDARYKAKIAEREIFLQKAYNEALERGEAEEVVKIRQQMTNEKARLEDERESEKERVRRGR